MMNRYDDFMVAKLESRDAPWQLREPAAVCIVWCLKCAVRLEWVPTQDGHKHSCGYRLSRYGPFEEPPSLFPTPKPLPPVWWIGNKPKDIKDADLAS